MELETLFQSDADADERGVSPVIGVILMVAITVILAAVIGTFVLGLGDNIDSTPQASWDFEVSEDSNTLNITHNGGDSIEKARLSVTGVGNDLGSTPSGLPAKAFNDPVKAGDTATVDIEGNSGDTVRLVYTAEGGDNSNVIATFDIPSDANV